MLLKYIEKGNSTSKKDLAKKTAILLANSKKSFTFAISF
jgi:hypothetical protein